jgi:hypothetical protein
MDAGPASRQQRFGMLTVWLMALLAIPLYLLVAIITFPVGVGLLMLFSDGPFVLNLYPFMFAGIRAGRPPVFFFNDSMRVLLTVVQWALIGWLFARQVDEYSTRGETLRNAASLLILVAIASAIVLHLFGLRVVWDIGARM